MSLAYLGCAYVVWGHGGLLGSRWWEDPGCGGSLSPVHYQQYMRKSLKRLLGEASSRGLLWGILACTGACTGRGEGEVRSHFRDWGQVLGEVVVVGGVAGAGAGCRCWVSA